MPWKSAGRYQRPSRGIREWIGSGALRVFRHSRSCNLLTLRALLASSLPTSTSLDGHNRSNNSAAVPTFLSNSVAYCSFLCFHFWFRLTTLPLFGHARWRDGFVSLCSFIKDGTEKDAKLYSSQRVAQGRQGAKNKNGLSAGELLTFLQRESIVDDKWNVSFSLFLTFGQLFTLFIVCKYCPKMHAWSTS